jgi:hypothetical protein
MSLSDDEYKNNCLTNGIMLRRTIIRALGISFHVETSYCRFMDVFDKRRSLFMLTLLASITSSMLTWIKYFKFPQRIFKMHKLKEKTFMFLNI